MIIATQGCNQVYFSDSEDYLAIECNSIVLVRGKKKLLIGTYRDMGRAQEALKSAVWKTEREHGSVMEFPRE